MATPRKTAPAKKTPAKKTTPPKPDRLNAEDLAAQYNYAYALLQSDKELKELFNQALTDKTGQWTQAKFVAKLRTTTWYRTHSETWRTSEALRLTDPEAYKAKGQEWLAKTRNVASTLGATLTDKEAADLSLTFYRLGYTDEQMNAALAAHINPPAMPGGLGGQAGQVEDLLRQTAQKNGQRYSDSFYLEAARGVVAGTADIAQWTDKIRADAASAYPVFADRIRSGMDVADLASNYMTKMADTLEIPVEDVTLADPHIKNALGGLDVTTGEPTAMGLWDFEKSLRSDPRWARTKQAKDQADAATMSVLQSFGFM